MKQIILKKDEKRLIPIMLGGDNSRHSGDERSEDARIDSGPACNASHSEVGRQARMTKKRLDVVLAGEGAEVEIAGLLMANGESQTSFEVYITHAAPKTKSNVNVRAVLRGKSKFDFRGNVKIEKGAKGSDAYLRSDALLFDDAKMGDDTPALEILERDVKAGHAATIGKVDEVMLFYLMSRGISKNQAERMLISGFVEPILRRLKTKD